MSQSSDILVQAVDVTLGYGPKTVLEKVSLSITAGEVVGLLGANGSGKTTLLKALCGAITPRAGEVNLLGQPVRTLSSKERARRAAYVPQGEDHEFDFTVRELTLMGRYAHFDGLFETPKDHAAAEKSMTASDCLEFAERKLSTLSGGEAQRALIARALAQESPVLLCDEPTTHLDPKHQMEVAQVLRSLSNDGRAIVVSTHDLNLADFCCDRIVLLKDQAILFDGPMKTAAECGHLDGAFGTKFYESEGYRWPARPT